MTEQEWSARNAHLGNMIDFLRCGGNERKLRLLAVAYCRRVWELILNDDCRRAVEVMERHIDGQASDRELAAVAQRVHEVAYEPGKPEELKPQNPIVAAIRSLFITPTRTYTYQTEHRAAHFAVAATVNRSHLESLSGVWTSTGQAVQHSLKTPHDLNALINVGEAEIAAYTRLVRDVVGNPFRPVHLHNRWLTWNDRTVPRLAQTIYEERAFDRLPILADALEDAGCANADILNHCREPSIHVRGCWVVDLLLGRS